MVNVHFLTPYHPRDIGKGLNQAIALLPANDWICLRDADTLFLTPQCQPLVIQIATENDHPGGVKLIGCRTNRVRSPLQHCGEALFESADINDHVAEAERRRGMYGSQVTPHPQGEAVAGLLMLFPVSLARLLRFEEKTAHFDSRFTAQARAIGQPVGIAQGLYLFHMYRWGRSNPADYVEHLGGQL